MCTASRELSHKQDPRSDIKQEGVSFGGEKGMNMLMRQDLQPLCQDCIILDGDMWLEFADGTKADTSKGVYNHHMTVGGDSMTEYYAIAYRIAKDHCNKQTI
jgi:hypothetical protein